ncbi:MAG: lactoylglutathione lyase [Flavobacteriales bacterium]|nr:lactoylglutathione lyase [Flavobacteriales bacterium]
MDKLLNTSIVEFILYVSDQSKSRDFYSQLLDVEPVLDVPGMTAFRLSEGVRLGLMPAKNIARIIHPAMPHPSSSNDVPKCELYLYVRDPRATYDKALSLGAKPISEVMPRDWGDLTGYVSDPDAHILAFALSNPNI